MPKIGLSKKFGSSSGLWAGEISRRHTWQGTRISQFEFELSTGFDFDSDDVLVVLSVFLGLSDVPEGFVDDFLSELRLSVL